MALRKIVSPTSDKIKDPIKQVEVRREQQPQGL
jgi:hypothetical protein